MAAMDTLSLNLRGNLEAGKNGVKRLQADHAA
jgi:hypothetical protein